MPSMPGWSWSAWPTESPGPITRLTTPFGTPASMYAWSMFCADSGEALGGLDDDRVAGHHRRARRSGGERHREVERADTTAKTPCGRRIERVWTAVVAEVVHRVVVAVVVLHRLRVVADQVGRLLDLAERLDAVLADLDRHRGRVVHQAVADQLRGATQDRRGAPPGGRGPGRLRGAGGRDGVVDVGGRALRERAEEEVAIDRRAGVEVPSASRHAPSM